MTPELDDLFARALRRIRRGASLTLQGTAFAGALVAAAPSLVGCAATETEDTDQLGGKSDWAQDEGESRPDLVSFTGEAWSECRESSSRTGCYGYEMFFKVMITPVASVDPLAKKVGIVYRSVESTVGDRTVNGYYFTTHGDGREEWHVPVRAYTYEDLIKFNVWYQPGNGDTYYDDNHGELHVFANNNAVQVIQAATWESTVQVTETGVRGTLKVRVADIDYDKVVGMHATVDGWATVLRFGIGAPGEKNKFYWVGDSWGNFEYWQIDLEIDGADLQELRYAVFYEHGVVNSARRYTFWDNNWGNDHRVTRGAGGGTP